MPIVPLNFTNSLKKLTCPVLIGPRSGSKTGNLTIPDDLAPGELRKLLPVTVVRVESLRDGVVGEGEGWTISRWLEEIESDASPELALKDGPGVVFANGNIRYCAAWPDRSLLDLLVERVAGEAGLNLMSLPEGVRIRRSASHIFAFNSNAHAVDLSSLDLREPVVGSTQMEPAATSIWTLP